MDVKRFGYIAKMGPYISIKEFEKLCLLYLPYIFTFYLKLCFQNKRINALKLRVQFLIAQKSKSFIHLSNQNYNFTCIVLWEAIHVIYWYIHLEFIFLIAYLTY